MMNRTPVYTIKGSTNPATWGTVPKTAVNTAPSYDDDWGAVKANFSANGFRMLTLDEWIYAANEGARQSSYDYSGSNNIGKVAWYDENSKEGNNKVPHNVGTKTPNALGLYDMTGNVDEYCMWVNNSGTPRRDYVGGSCTNNKDACKISAFENRAGGSVNTFRWNTTGFRLGCTVTGSGSSGKAPASPASGSYDIIMDEGDRMKVSVSGGVKWKSSDKSVVTVNAKGKVVAVGAGTAILKSSSGTKMTILVDGGDDGDDWDDDEDW